MTTTLGTLKVVSPSLPRWQLCTGTKVPFRLSSAASEGGSSWGPGSLLLREDESSSAPAVEGADFAKAPGMERDTVREAGVCGERALKPAP